MDIIVLPSVEKTINLLEPSLRGRLINTLLRLEKYGPYLTLPFSKKISSDLYELRVVAKIQLRVIYCLQGGKAVLLNCFIKKSQKIPQKEMDLAKNRKKRFDMI